MPLTQALNALVGGAFLLLAFGQVATRQTLGCLRYFVWQSVCLALSAFLLGASLGSWHLAIVGAINLVTKPVLIPWLLRRMVPPEAFRRREIQQALNIPSSLLLALALTVAAVFFALPLLAAMPRNVAGVNLPVGMAGVFLGAYTLSVRNEAVPQLLGLLAMENGAFFAGVALDLPLVAELTVTFDLLIMALVIGLLTRALHERIGTTRAGELAALHEEVEP